MSNYDGALPWYHEDAGFFGPYYVETYEDVTQEGQTEEEVKFLDDVLQLSPGSSILDLACGPGRHCLKLAQRGYHVTGLDLSSHFLNRAQESMKTAGVQVELIHKDMRDIPYESKYDAVLNLFTSFGYFEDEQDDDRVMGQVYKALRPGGLFILDFVNRERLIRNHRGKDWVAHKDHSIEIFERKLNLYTGIHHDQRTRIYPDGVRKSFDVFLRLYSAAELIKKGQRAGFSLKAAYGDYSGGSLTMDSGRVLLIMRKG